MRQAWDCVCQHQKRQSIITWCMLSTHLIHPCLLILDFFIDSIMDGNQMQLWRTMKYVYIFIASIIITPLTLIYARTESRNMKHITKQSMTFQCHLSNWSMWANIWWSTVFKDICRSGLDLTGRRKWQWLHEHTLSHKKKWIPPQLHSRVSFITWWIYTIDHDSSSLLA